MASTQQSETTTFLRSPLDWHAWEREFRSYVATYDLSDKFFREEPFLARPVQPKIIIRLNYRHVHNPPLHRNPVPGR
jgi:hypothetical protein